MAVEKLLAHYHCVDDRAARRLEELMHKGTCHDWLWIINPRDGSRLAEEDFLLALGNRLGASLVTAGDSQCKMCGEVLDATASHAMCCAKGECTRGHYCIVGRVADGISIVDPALQTEVRGLAGTTDRPADILTVGALPGTRTALDITVASQDAFHAGTDACATAYRRKMTRYSSILPALRRAGVVFQPMVWSAEGRPHPATVRVLESTLKIVRARKSIECAAELRSRWRHEIAIAIQRRKAAMIRAVLPDRSSQREWLARGGLPTEGRREQLPTLEEEAASAELDAATP